MKHASEATKHFEMEQVLVAKEATLIIYGDTCSNPRI